MGYTKKKLVQRDSISGFHYTNDVADGTYGAEELSKRSASMQEQLNEAITADWTPGKSKPESTDKCLGDSYARVKAIVADASVPKDTKA